MKIYPLFSLLLLFFCSCKTEMFIPEKVNCMGLKEAGQVRADVSARMQDHSHGKGAPFSYSGHLAYAPINHLGVFASYYRLQNKYADNDLLYNASRFDAGAGYFFKRDDVGFSFEALAGYSQGRSGKEAMPANYGKELADVVFNYRYNRLFLQLGANSYGHLITFSSGIRFTRQHISAMSAYGPATDPPAPVIYPYQHQHTNNPNKNNEEYVARLEATTGRTFAFAEPFSEIQAGTKYLKATLQAGMPFYLFGPRTTTTTTLITPTLYLPALYHYGCSAEL
jgi:hypothetical protein